MGSFGAVAGQQRVGARPGYRDKVAVRRQRGGRILDVVVLPIDADEIVAGKDDLRTMASLPVADPGTVPGFLLGRTGLRAGRNDGNDQKDDGEPDPARKRAGGSVNYGAQGATFTIGLVQTWSRPNSPAVICRCSVPSPASFRLTGYLLPALGA